MAIRHANMLIGLSGTGKTTVIKTLASALSSLPGENKVIVHTLNPKAVSLNCLFGYYDAKTSEWKDGIISKIMRKCA